MKARGIKIIAIVFFALVLSTGLAGFRPAKLVEESVLVMNISGDVPEAVPYNPLWGLFSPPPLTVLDKEMLLQKAAADRKVMAVVVAIRDNSLGIGKAQELRGAISKFRKSRKPAICYMEMEGHADISYYLATACDKIYVAPSSFMNINGIATLHFYLGGLFEKVKLSIQVVKIREYKTAGDMLFRRDMSPEDREMSESLLSSIWDQYLAGIAAARGKTRDEMSKNIDQDLTLPEKFQKAGMIDGVKYLDEIVKDVQGGKKGLAEVNEREYQSLPAEAQGINIGPRVAVIFGVGNIVNLDPGGSPFAGSIMSAERTVKELEAVAKDDTIKAVIFRIDSGGGSALASDLIWHATQKVREKKPIIVSMGEVAGSGGYYIACGADKIVAQPGTLTGSIGVLSAHIGAKGLINWMQVGTATLSRGQYSQMDDWTRPWTDAETAKAMEGIQGNYELFLSRVSQGRKMSRDDVDKIGRGRVYTGMQAKEIGLVDELGGMDSAVEIIKRRLGVRDVNLIYKRKPVSLWKLLTGKTEEELVSTAFGPQAVELRNIMMTNNMYKEGERLFLSPVIKVE
jgi:protease-4